MGLLSTLFPALYARPENRAVQQPAKVEKRSYQLSDPNFWSYFNLGSLTRADVPITHLSILGNSPWFSALRYISEGVAMLDRQVKRKMSGRVRTVENHPVAELLSDQPHPYYTWFDLIAALLVNACYGNGYARIWRDPMTMRPVYVEHIPSTAVALDFDYLGGLVYRISGLVAGRPVNVSVPPSDMVHVKGLSLDGLQGVSTLVAHADVHGTGLALNQYSAATLGQGAAPSIAITNEDDMTWAELKSARENFMSQYAGTQNAGVPVFLGKGQGVEYLSLRPSEVSFEAFGRMNVADVARLTKVPLDLLGVENGGTYGAGVQRSKDFLTHCLRPWIERIQEEFTRKLFYHSEQGRYSFEFDLSMYLELDRAAEVEALVRMVSGTIMTPNEAREKMGLDAVEGGDELLTDINQVPLKNVLEVALAKYLSSKGEAAQADASQQAADIEDAAEVIDDTKPAPKGTAKTDAKNEQPEPKPAA